MTVQEYNTKEEADGESNWVTRFKKVAHRSVKTMQDPVTERQREIEVLSGPDQGHTLHLLRGGETRQSNMKLAAQMFGGKKWSECGSLFSSGYCVWV